MKGKRIKYIGTVAQAVNMLRNSQQIKCTFYTCDNKSMHRWFSTEGDLLATYNRPKQLLTINKRAYLSHNQRGKE